MMCPRSAICHMCWARTNSVVLTKKQWKCSSSWPSLRRTLSKYVTLSVDNLVSLNEQQFVDSVSQRADELKPLGYESLPHFSPKSLLSRPESEDPKVLTSQLYLFFFEFRRIRHRTRMLIPFPARLCALSLTVQQGSSLLSAQGTQVEQIIFTRGHDPSTPVRRARSLTAVG